MRFMILSLVVFQMDISDQDKLKELIVNLGDNDSKVRDESLEKLVEIGKLAYELLREASEKNKDIEIKERAKTAMFKIEWAGERALESLVDKFSKEWEKEKFKAELFEKKDQVIDKYFKNHRFFMIYKVHIEKPERHIAKHYYLKKFDATVSEFKCDHFGIDFPAINVLTKTEDIKITSEKEAYDFISALGKVLFPTTLTVTNKIKYTEERKDEQIVKKIFSIPASTVASNKMSRRRLMSAIEQTGLELHVTKDDKLEKVTMSPLPLVKPPVK